MSAIGEVGEEEAERIELSVVAQLASASAAVRQQAAAVREGQGWREVKGR